MMTADHESSNFSSWIDTPIYLHFIFEISTLNKISEIFFFYRIVWFSHDADFSNIEHLPNIDKKMGLFKCFYILFYRPVTEIVQD